MLHNGYVLLASVSKGLQITASSTAETTTGGGVGGGGGEEAAEANSLRVCLLHLIFSFKIKTNKAGYIAKQVHQF